ncbi:hypothetical protein N7448_008947 [Penicillium atrosanguineum]|uniref:Uncharacterized protein n=1 Tax=Penicillium atrosanguineum TaxID=1132637 RepID=A0A9W9GS80_9EURO|nr:hypothetical protein N7448_008947 [Penicillium atrosanguineum]KAJ5330247.1 hypothetical protein N7476_000030 [Penicillium atrosanguineum]
MRSDIVQLRQVDDAVGYLMEVVPRGVQESTPWARDSSWENHSFTPECREAIKVIWQLRRQFTTSQDNGDWQEYTSARNRKGKAIHFGL